MRKIIAIIPARYSSSRFQGKPLAKIKGKPMIQWVYETISRIDEIDELYVATDDLRIAECVESFDGKYIMTSDKHNSGSDRIAECALKININDDDIILNIQGDEPMIKEEMVRELINAFNDEEVYMATLKKQIIDENEINNSNVVKVITDINNDAIYFSRSTIPNNRENVDGVKYYKHIGVYAYKKSFLIKFTELNESSIELIEKLEQLRVIENGFKIRVLETEYQTIGVDLPEHIALVENEI
ncbi:MAG: 3-deoxy-manno-octulosonate cytidylyltransferase [Clostridium saudiense]|uniref:3-deoxy-manno-octulosonate cytidylyltransferase n=1 Tax=Clostridium saudiense TaxID=1414720 RepID=UPI0039946576